MAFRQLIRVLGGGVALVLAAAIIVPVVWALLAQTYGPDDGTVVELAGSAAVRTSAGVGYRIQHADSQNGLRTGDVVVAIDGRPVSRSDQPPHQAGERLNYQVERAGQTIDVPVVLHTASWRERIVDQWAIYLLPALLLPIGGYVFARPRERAAQLMLAAGALFVIGTVSSPYGPRVIDLTGGRGQWVFVVAEIANAALWAVLLHFTLVFPQRSRLVLGRRWLIPGGSLAAGRPVRAEPAVGHARRHVRPRVPPRGARLLEDGGAGHPAAARRVSAGGLPAQPDPGRANPDAVGRDWPRRRSVRLLRWSWPN